MKYILLIFLSLSFVYQPIAAQKNLPPLLQLKPIKKLHIKVPEPSDICINLSGNGFYIVSDNGYLYETDFEGKILKKAAFSGADFEGVWVNKNTKEIFVADESLRRFEVFNADLEHLRSHVITLMAGRNEGVESGTFDEQNRQHVVFTEKNPVELLIFNEEFNIGSAQHHKIKGIKEVSACTFYQGRLWVLSDEERTVYETDYPEGKNILRRYQIPVLNPEGLCFLPDGTMVIASDDLEKLFFFQLPKS